MVGAVLSAVDELVYPRRAFTRTCHLGLSSGTFIPGAGLCLGEDADYCHTAGWGPVVRKQVRETSQCRGRRGRGRGTAAARGGIYTSLLRIVWCWTTDSVYAHRSIISGMGIIGTHVNYLFGSESDRNDPKILAGLKKKLFQTTLADLKEVSPVIKAVFWLSDSNSGGEGEEGAPSAVDYVEYHTGLASSGTSMSTSSNGSGIPFLRVWSPSAKDPLWRERHPDVHAVVMEMEQWLYFISC